MIGENAPLNGIILGTKYIGKTATIISEAKAGGTDDVTTRAMRLKGLENKINQGGNNDSYSRASSEASVKSKFEFIEKPETLTLPPIDQ